MDFSVPISGVYCERTSADFWAEPLNAGSSLIVVVVGLFGVVALHRAGRLTPMVAWLVALSIAIGIGSFLLHTFATGWAELADVLPIWAFVAVFGLAVTLRFRPGRRNLPMAAAYGIILFGSGTALATSDATGLAATLSGSAQYIPAGLMIASVIWFLWGRNTPRCCK